jgi:hypothetical protein
MGSEGRTIASSGRAKRARAAEAWRSAGEAILEKSLDEGKPPEHAHGPDRVMKRPRRSALQRCAAIVLIFIAVGSCGGGGGGEGGPAPVTVSTLAYVVTECRADADRTLGIRQSLQIRRGEQAPITVVEHSARVPGAGFYCRNVGVTRSAPDFAELGVFRRLGVTPDGSRVVFEVTDEEVTDWVGYQLVFPPHMLPDEERGIFVVGADGTGLHKLGPASRVASFYLSLFTFSPDGRTIAYTDRGPSRDNEDAVQIFTLNLVTGGDRRQVTQLPPASGLFGGTYQPLFNDDQTITFSTHANADRNHPGGENIVVTVKTDGTGLTVASPVIALPGSELLTSFRITASELDAAVLILPGTPVNSGIGNSGAYDIQEVFDIDRDNNILQLTNFRRVDTLTPTVSADGNVLFTASVNPPSGTNPAENCQVFSIDRTGGDLRQLTNFHEGPEGQESRAGCSFYERPFGCLACCTSRDIRSDAVVFYSSCDPFGTNPYGSQVFAMHSDGTGLRQLTNTHGYTRDASGGVTVELPFPFAWPGYQLRGQLR